MSSNPQRKNKRKNSKGGKISRKWTKSSSVLSVAVTSTSKWLLSRFQSKMTPKSHPSKWILNGWKVRAICLKSKVKKGWKCLKTKDMPSYKISWKTQISRSPKPLLSMTTMQSCRAVNQISSSETKPCNLMPIRKRLQMKAPRKASSRSQT